MSKKVKDKKDKEKRICDSCIYDYFCMRINRPWFTCKDYLPVEEGKTSADYAK